MTDDRPISLVLVDDTVDVRRLLWKFLERTGDFTVVGEAGDGARAVEVAREFQPDLILLDVAMPEMDGLEALPLLRQASPRSRVVMYTGFEGSRLAPKARRLGASGYIEKGTPPDEIATSLRRALRGDD